MISKRFELEVETWKKTKVWGVSVAYIAFEGCLQSSTGTCPPLMFCFFFLSHYGWWNNVKMYHRSKDRDGDTSNHQNNAKCKETVTRQWWAEGGARGGLRLPVQRGPPRPRPVVYARRLYRYPPLVSFYPLFIYAVFLSGNDLRIKATPREITEEGFEVEVATWSDTKVFGCHVSWLAFTTGDTKYSSSSSLPSGSPTSSPTTNTTTTTTTTPSSPPPKNDNSDDDDEKEDKTKEKQKGKKDKGKEKAKEKSKEKAKDTDGNPLPLPPSPSIPPASSSPKDRVLTIYLQTRTTTTCARCAWTRRWTRAWCPVDIYVCARSARSRSRSTRSPAPSVEPPSSKSSSPSPPSRHSPPSHRIAHHPPTTSPHQASGCYVRLLWSPRLQSSSQVHLNFKFRDPLLVHPHFTRPLLVHRPSPTSARTLSLLPILLWLTFVSLMGSWILWEFVYFVH